MEKQLKYWNQSIENINKDPRNNKFIIVVNQKKYKVPLSYAFGISPFITEQFLKDPTYNHLNIIINTNENKEITSEKIQKEFQKFIKGETISSDIFYEIGIQLKNKEMIKKWIKNQILTKETVINIIKANYKLFIKDNNYNQGIEMQIRQIIGNQIIGNQIIKSENG